MIRSLACSPPFPCGECINSFTNERPECTQFAHSSCGSRKMSLRERSLRWKGNPEMRNLVQHLRHGRAASICLVAVGGIAVACIPFAVQRSAPPAVAVHETATEFAFDQPTLRLQPGQRVTLTLENGGKTEHNLRIDALAKQVVAKPGKT